MSKWLILSGLVLLNLILGTAVYQKIGGERAAFAQIGQQKLNVASVAGVQNGQTMIYMLDISSGGLIAIRVDLANRTANRIASRNVAADLRSLR
jgi:hypothetical protein